MGGMLRGVALGEEERERRYLFQDSFEIPAF